MDGIPTLVFVDGMTGNLITRDGRDIIVSDPNGDKFPWSPPSFSEVIVNCKFISRDKKKTAWRQLKGKIVGIFFSFPWVKYSRYQEYIINEGKRVSNAPYWCSYNNSLETLVM